MRVVPTALLVVACLSLCTAAWAPAKNWWRKIDVQLPSAVEWDATKDASVLAENTGEEIWWDATWALRSVEGPTASAILTDRWGLELVPVEGTVPPGGEYLFEFGVVGPPITTLLYDLPLTPTSAAIADTLDCNWMVSVAGVLDDTDIAAQGTVVSRFPDDQPSTTGEWARFWIEELAGRVPLVVQGYPDGTYRPSEVVTRDQMAVYISRGWSIPTGLQCEGLFSDVDDTQWAWPWIEALARANVVQGYPDGTYRPTQSVNRGQMAVYVARSIYGALTVPPGPAVGHFSDVPDYDPGPAHPFYDFIEFAVAHNVVKGYPDGTYRPDNNVTRDQMAVFVWKGSVMPIGTAVVLGGPAITDQDPQTAGYLGWSTLATSSAADPGFAYVVLDAARLTTDMAPLEVKFVLRKGPSVAIDTVPLPEEDIQKAIDAVTSSGGVPYLVVSWHIPPVDPGDYELVVSIAGNEVARQPHITLE